VLVFDGLQTVFFDWLGQDGGNAVYRPYHLRRVVGDKNKPKRQVANKIQ
jgi:hypothetical protein